MLGLGQDDCTLFGRPYELRSCTFRDTMTAYSPGEVVCRLLRVVSSFMSVTGGVACEMMATASEAVDDERAPGSEEQTVKRLDARMKLK